MQKGTLNPSLGCPAPPVPLEGRIYLPCALEWADLSQAGSWSSSQVWSRRVTVHSRGRSSSSSWEGLEEASKGKAGFDGRPGWCPEVPTRTQNGKEEVRNHLGWAGQEGWARDVTQSWL